MNIQNLEPVSKLEKHNPLSPGTISEKNAKKVSIARDIENINDYSNTGRNARISRWFVSNQKTEKWDGKKLDAIHLFIIVLLFILYGCHIISSAMLPQLLQDQNTVTAITIFESFLLLVSIACWLFILRVNGSWVATKMIFGKGGGVRTGIYIFWMVRFITLELLKRRFVFGFVFAFHSALIYSCDMWYLCNRVYLIFSLVMFLSILVYEFLFSISPYAPADPWWMFMKVKTSANSLSRSNLFNLFVIFFDALLEIIYDKKRHKYIMLVKKQKRVTFVVTTERKKMLVKLWIMMLILGACALAIFISYRLLNSEEMFSFEVYNIVFLVTSIPALILFIIIYWYSSRDVRAIAYKLIHERRVICVIILLIVLFYIDMSLQVSMAGILFPVIILSLISIDFIGGYFPKRMSKILAVMILTMLCWNIFYHTFLNEDCAEPRYMRKWGLYGQTVSICTVKRLIHQSILSLFMSPFIAINTGRINHLFFCNANLYRSTGTVSDIVTDEDYVNNLSMEKNHVKLLLRFKDDEEEDGTRNICLSTINKFFNKCWRR